MTWLLYDAEGYLGMGPSTAGLKNLRESLVGAEASRFFHAGYHEDPAALAGELAGEDLDRVAPDVAKSARNLMRAAKRADTILILTDGIDIDDEAGGNA